MDRIASLGVSQICSRDSVRHRSQMKDIFAMGSVGRGLSCLAELHSGASSFFTCCGAEDTHPIGQR